MRSCRALPTSYSFSTFVRSGEVLVRWESCLGAQSAGVPRAVFYGRRLNSTFVFDVLLVHECIRISYVVLQFLSMILRARNSYSMSYGL